MKKHTPRLHPGQGTRTGVGGWVVKAGLDHYKFSIHVHFFFILSFKVLWFCVTIVTFSNTSCIYVPIYLLGLHWVFVAGHRFSLVVKIRGYCLIVVHGASHCSGFCCC